MPCRSTLMLFVPALAVGLLGGRPVPTAAATPAAGPPGQTKLDLKVALVLPGLTNDAGFNQVGYESLRQAQDALGVTARYVENIANPDAPKIMRDYAAEGFHVVFGYSGGFVNAVQQVAPDFPRTTFVAIADRNVKFPDNVWVIRHDYTDGFYLDGVLAGLMTKTNKLGFVGGAKFKSYVAASMAFEEGAKAVNRNAQVFVTFIGNFNDPVAAKQTAVAQIQNGADIIQSAVDNGVIGLMEAARGAKGVRILHYQKNICDQAPDVLLASYVMDYPAYVKTIIKQVAAGQKGGFVSNSVSKGTNHIVPCVSLPGNVMAKFSEMQEKVRKGEIKYTEVVDVK